MPRKNQQCLDFTGQGLLTGPQAAELLGTTVGYVYRMSYLGLLKTWKIGTLSYYDKREVLGYKRTHPQVGQQLPTR